MISPGALITQSGFPPDSRNAAVRTRPRLCCPSMAMPEPAALTSAVNDEDRFEPTTRTKASANPARRPGSPAQIFASSSVSCRSLRFCRSFPAKRTASVDSISRLSHLSRDSGGLTGSSAVMVAWGCDCSGGVASGGRRVQGPRVVVLSGAGRGACVSRGRWPLVVPCVRPDPDHPEPATLEGRRHPRRVACWRLQPERRLCPKKRLNSACGACGSRPDQARSHDQALQSVTNTGAHRTA